MPEMPPFDFHLRTRLVFGSGSMERLGTLARSLGFTKPLLVADHGLQDAGHVERAERLLRDDGIEAVAFHDFGVNPNTAMVERGCAFAATHDVDAIIGLGGGSSLDCAKGINFLLTNGGTIADYQGYGKASKPMLPMLAIPTTAGTGSEAQSYAVIADADTHMKMACGDPKLAFKIALLDPELTLSQPAAITAARRLRRDRARGRDRGDDPTHTGLGPVLSRGLPAPRRQLRDSAGQPGRPRRTRRNAPGRLLRRPCHRAIDAWRRARLRQSADRAPPDHA